MPTYIVKGKAHIIRVIAAEQRIEADSPARARNLFRGRVAQMHGGNVTIETCELSEGAHGQVQDRLDGGGG